MGKFKVERTVTKELPHPLDTMCYFIEHLEEMGLVTRSKELTDDRLAECAVSFWDRRHGED